MSDDGQSAGTPAAAAGTSVEDLVRTSCAVRNDHQEPALCSTCASELDRRVWLIEEAIRAATPLNADTRSPQDLLLVLAFRWAVRAVAKLPVLPALEQIAHVADILHIEKLPDGTLLRNDVAGSVLAPPHRVEGG